MKLTACALILVSIAFAAPPRSVRLQLEADYALFAKAWHTKNLDPTYPLMTDDFTAVGLDSTGKAVDRKEMIAKTKDLLAADHITWPRRIISLSVHGKIAVATLDSHFTGMMPGRNGAKPTKLEILAKTKDTWVLVGKVWKFKRLEILSSSMMVNGKPMKR